MLMSRMCDVTIAYFVTQGIIRFLFIKKEIGRLHISVAINHSLVEDPAVFLAMDIAALWLWVSKFVIVIVVVAVWM